MTVDISTTENSIYLAKEEGTGLITIAAQKIKPDLFEITYFCNGVVRIIKSASLLLARTIASLAGVDYLKVSIAVEDVA